MAGLDIFSTSTEVQARMRKAREDRARYLSELGSRSGRRLRRVLAERPRAAALALGTAAVLVLGGFASSRLIAPMSDPAGISPTALTADAGNLPIAPMPDAH